MLPVPQPPPGTCSWCVLLPRLETDIAVLEQHLETMRSTYQLNSEKLEYNYRVLLERDAGVLRCAALQTRPPAASCPQFNAVLRPDRPPRTPR